MVCQSGRVNHRGARRVARICRPSIWQTVATVYRLRSMSCSRNRISEIRQSVLAVSNAVSGDAYVERNLDQQHSAPFYGRELETCPKIGNTVLEMCFWRARSRMLGSCRNVPTRRYIMAALPDCCRVAASLPVTQHITAHLRIRRIFKPIQCSICSMLFTLAYCAIIAEHGWTLLKCGHFSV